MPTVTSVASSTGWLRSSNEFRIRDRHDGFTDSKEEGR